MYPILFPGDIVYYKKKPSSKIIVDNIVVIKNNNSLSTHRVIYKNKDVFITKGDNNRLADKRIKFNNIMGVVYKIKRKNRFFYPEEQYLMQSTIYFRIIKKIINEFDFQKIEYVFLKGLPFYLHYFKNSPNNIYSDIDILVKKTSSYKIDKILTNLGFLRLSKKLKEDSIEDTYYKTITGQTVVVDIHFQPSFFITKLGNINLLFPNKLVKEFTNKLFLTKKIALIDSCRFNLLEPNYQFVYLCLHYFHHGFQTIRQINVINNFIIYALSKKLTDWNLIILIIKSYQFENFIYPVLNLLKTYYKTPLPLGLSLKLRPSKQLPVNFMKKIDIFNQKGYLDSGISKFILIFILSPRPIYIKILLFLNPKVVKLVIYSLKEKLFSFLLKKK